MDIFSSTLSPRGVNSGFSSGFGSLRSPARVLHVARRPDLQCGWHDSSFELREGLEVIEEQDDTLYQLWELSATPGSSGLR